MVDSFNVESNEVKSSTFIPLTKEDAQKASKCVVDIRWLKEKKDLAVTLSKFSSIYNEDV